MEDISTKLVEDEEEIGVPNSFCHVFYNPDKSELAGMARLAPALSAAVSSFQIGGCTWKLEEKIHNIGKVTEKREMVETFQRTI